MNNGLLILLVILAVLATLGGGSYAVWKILEVKPSTASPPPPAQPPTRPPAQLPAQPDYLKHEHTNGGTGYINAVAADSAEDCKPICNDTEGCGAFMYGDGKCWLKKTATPNWTSEDATLWEKQ